MATYEIMDNNTRRALTDDEAKTFFPPQVALTADKLTVTADGVDFVTITAQLKSVPLSDDTQADLPLVHPIVLIVDETEISAETDANGRASFELEFEDKDTYEVSVKFLNANPLTIQAV